MKIKLASKILASALVASTLLLSSCGKVQNTNYQNPLQSNPTDNSYNPVNTVNNTPINTGTGSVIGRVVDASGKGLQGVTVAVKNVVSATSFTGDFQLNNVPQGQQVLILKYGNRQITLNVNVQSDTAISPEVNPVQFSNNGTGGSGIANTQLKTFPVDQDFFNQWQAKSVSVLNGVIYVAVADQTGIIKRGSVIRMDTETGKNWKNIGSTWLGLRFPIDKTVTGVAAASSNLVLVDTKGSMYNVDLNKKVKAYKNGGGTDIAIGSGNVYVVNGSNVEKTDMTGSTRTPIKNLSVSGGICADGKGTLYAVSGSTIKKVEFTTTESNVTDLITDGISNVIDVAVDDKNGFVYVLSTTDIKRFDMKGVLMTTFGTGSVKPVSITTDELGNVYVADEGKDSKTSKIVKFAPGNNVIPEYQNQDFAKALQTFEGTNDSSTTDTPATDSTTTDSSTTTDTTTK